MHIRYTFAKRTLMTAINAWLRRHYQPSFVTSNKLISNIYSFAYDGIRLLFFSREPMVTRNNIHAWSIETTYARTSFPRKSIIQILVKVQIDLTNMKKNSNSNANDSSRFPLSVLQFKREDDWSLLHIVIDCCRWQSKKGSSEEKKISVGSADGNRFNSIAKCKLPPSLHPHTFISENDVYLIIKSEPKTQAKKKIDSAFICTANLLNLFSLSTSCVCFWFLIERIFRPTLEQNKEK